LGRGFPFVTRGKVVTKVTKVTKKEPVKALLEGYYYELANW